MGRRVRKKAHPNETVREYRKTDLLKSMSWSLHPRKYVIISKYMKRCSP